MRVLQLTKFLKGATVAALFLPAVMAWGQDWPMLQGSDARTGLNNAVDTGGPGVGNLVWWQPQNSSGSFVRQAMSPEASSTNGGQVWTTYGLSNLNQEAYNVYFPVQTGIAVEDLFSGYTNYAAAGTNAVDYYAAATIASSTNLSQPTQKENAGDSLNTFSWKVEPANPANRTAQNFTLYTWVPIGASIFNGNSEYQQNYAVYTVQYGAGSIQTFVINLEYQTGWVQIGAPQSFYYDGTDPIVVTLYNTVPRDALGNLTSATGTTLVYADAVLAVSQGTGQAQSYLASPIVSAFNPTAGTGIVHAVAAVNQSSVDQTTGNTINNGVVTSYVYNNGAPRWTFSPSQVAQFTTTMAATSAGVTSATPWAQTTTNVGNLGSPYLTSTVTNTLTNAQSVIYKPTIADGSYQIKLWVPGSGGGLSFAQALLCEIHEGTAVTTVTVNEDTAGGWEILGDRRFVEDNAHGNPLTVYITNYSGQASDASRTAFADSVEFVGADNLAIDSTPVQTTCLITPPGGGTPVSTAVTLVAAEDGRIYCLDSTGNTHGGTTLYWTYPSLPTVVPDPNQVPGLDGPGPTAMMPTGFNLSSAIVETLAGHPYLYIASTNGRVYSIDMEGRGDTTTTREWSYPDDYPAVAVTSNLGATAGSLAFVNDGVAPPMVIVPARQGRVYALSALGNTATRTTTPIWEFPNGDESQSNFTNYTSAARVAGDVVWNNPGNAQTQDQNYATATPDNGNGGTGNSQYLEGTVPNTLNVPAGANITGIEVVVVKHRSTGDNGLYIHDANVQLLQGGTISSQNRADTVDDWPTTDATSVYGGQTDLWGNTWTSANFGAGFGVAIAVNGNGNSTTNTTLPIANIDYVQVRVFYNAQTATGGILATPTVAFGNIYFGAQAVPGSNGGQFYCVNQDTGALQWTFVGTNAWTPGGGSITYAGNFSSGATAIPAAELNEYVGTSGLPTQSDSIVVMNDNEWLTSLYADGANAGQVQWTTNELGTSVVGNVSYTPMTVYTNTATLTAPTQAAAPTVIIPTADGRFDALFAMNDGNLLNGSTTTTNTFGAKNKDGTRRAWEYVSTGTMSASVAIGRGYVLGGDSHGVLYAFGNGASSSSGTPPGYSTATENNPGGNGEAQDFSDTIISQIYPPGGSSTVPPGQQVLIMGRLNNLTYADLANYAPQPTGTPAYEWGQTVYVVLYHFPYTAVTNTTGNPPIMAPTANFQMSVGTESLNLSYQAMQFPSSDTTVPVSTLTGARLDGYVIFPLTLTAGNNAIFPGLVRCSASITTAGTTNPPQSVNVTLTYGLGTSYTNFYVNNPLALLMPPAVSGADTSQQIGYSTLLTNPQAQANGNPASVSTAGDTVTLLTAEEGLLDHGTSGSVTVGVVDRSLLVQLGGPGLPVRLQPSDLAWQGTTVLNPMPAVFQNFEDYPINSPNDSFDYPDIAEDQVSVVSNASGTATTPLTADSNLLFPTNVTTTGSRTLTTTPWNVTLNVPRFQPPNETPTAISNGTSNYGGYKGIFTVYVDTTKQGVLNTPTSGPEPYRYFTLASGVAPNLNLYTTTPTVDLGQLPAGAGKPSADQFSAWIQNGPFYNMFQPFNATNAGNVNLINLGVGKYEGPTASALTHLGINATNGNSLSWLDDAVDVVSNIDPKVPSGGRNQAYDLATYLGLGYYPAVIQKPRVTNTSPTVLLTNPIRQTNANLSVTQGPLFTSGPTPAAPRITVTVPFGMPVGTYADMVQLLENDNTSITDPEQIIESGGTLGTGMTLASPSFTLIFHVQETGLTNNVSAPLDTLLDVYGSSSSTGYMYPNEQPAAFRDPSGLHVVFTSSRPSFAPAGPPTGPATTSPFALYAATLASSNETAFGQNPLSDLDLLAVQNGSNTMFSRDAGPFPASSSTSSLFLPPGLSGYSVNANYPVQYTSPAFPNSLYNPFATTPTLNGSQYMVFLGQAQILNGSNQAFIEDHVMIAPATDSSGPLNLGAATVLSDDIAQQTALTSTIKDRPTIVQVNNDATVFYSAGGGGKGTLYAATFNGASSSWQTNEPISLPAGFESVGQPHASGRLYSGATVTGASGTPIISNGQRLLEVAFQGKMSGREHPDIYLMRLPSDPNGVPTSYSPMDMLPISNESLPAVKNGVYTSDGVGWDTNQPLWISLTYPTGATTTATTSFVLSPAVTTLPLAPPGTIVTPPVNVDPQTGIISFDGGAATGGKVYVNPADGNIEFTQAPPSNTTVSLTYTPRIVRVSSGATSDSYPTVLYDDRPLGGSNLNDWFQGSGSNTAPVSSTANVQADRYIITYGGLATGGAGHGATPWLSTYRFGVQLPNQVATSGGSVVSFQVMGNAGDCQVDPAKGMVYFTAADEGSVVSFTYDTYGANNTATPTTVNNVLVSLVPEQSENAIPIVGTVDESQITSFLDYNQQGPTSTVPGRPGLIWLFWTSTRNGAPDVYFETIAPNFAATTVP